jgi:DNA-binding transcriptional MerR regulator
MDLYTIKQIADMAGVSRRTLHFYDEKGLLKPSRVGNNGYRYYDEDSLLRLQQIMLYREMGLELQQIKIILEDPDFDMVSVLQVHRQNLRDKIDRLQTLIRTVDATLMHLMGELDMKGNNMFEGFTEEKQKQYDKEAIESWGEKASRSINLWNSYSQERRQAIMQEGKEIYEGIVSNMGKGTKSPEIRALLKRWHEHLKNYYEPTLEILKGLGEMYYDHPDFNANFSKMHPDLPAFLKEAILIYVNDLEKK